MYTITTMPRPKTPGPSLNFQLRLSGEPAARYMEIIARARGRNARADNTDINRRLLGLDPDTDGLVTDMEVAYFRGEIALEDLGGSDSRPLLKESPPKGKKKR